MKPGTVVYLNLDGEVCDHTGLPIINSRSSEYRAALESVQHNRSCPCYGRGGPCDRCRVGYDEVDTALRPMENPLKARELLLRAKEVIEELAVFAGGVNDMTGGRGIINDSITEANATVSEIERLLK